MSVLQAATFTAMAQGDRLAAFSLIHMVEPDRGGGGGRGGGGMCSFSCESPSNESRRGSLLQTPPARPARGVAGGTRSLKGFTAWLRLNGPVSWSGFHRALLDSPQINYGCSDCWEVRPFYRWDIGVKDWRPEWRIPPGGTGVLMAGM